MALGVLSHTEAGSLSLETVANCVSAPLARSSVPAMSWVLVEQIPYAGIRDLEKR